MELFDTHCHLQFDKLAGNLNGILANAQAAKVTRLLCVGTSVSDSQAAIELAGHFDSVWATVGVHPHEAKGFFNNPSAETKLQALYKKPKIVAVGEIGLDFYKNYSPPADQEKLFHRQLELSRETELPYVFHVRDAFKKFWHIFDSFKNLHGVVHSFSASPAELDEALSRGLYVALNGIMTFTSDEQQLAAAKQVPKDRLLLETDAPFLTPGAQRGRVCEPAFVRDIAVFLADLRGESIEELASYTTKNARDLFKL